MYNDVLQEMETKMKKTVGVLREDLKTIRAGRANPGILDNITVEAYGVQTPLNQVAGITVPEARLIAIQPWDKGLLKEIEKALLKSNIGITPQSDGTVIRLPFPDLTEDRRRELAKQVGEYQERSKVALRNSRRDGIDEVKKREKNSDLTEDERHTAEKDIQDLTDKYSKEIDDICEAKEKELMEF
ncbi:MAG: ribosome recycling factor [Tissierellia bacterium]|nr:ribosome recycling factor [Tissierellia bacterium]